MTGTLYYAVTRRAIEDLYELIEYIATEDGMKGLGLDPNFKDLDGRGPINTPLIALDSYNGVVVITPNINRNGMTGHNGRSSISEEGLDKVVAMIKKELSDWRKRGYIDNPRAVVHASNENQIHQIAKALGLTAEKTHDDYFPE